MYAVIPNSTSSRFRKRNTDILEVRKLIADKNLEQAYRKGTSMISRYKRDAELHYLLGLVAEQTAQLVIAKDHATKAVRYRPHPDALFLLSRIERVNGNTDVAIELCDRALEVQANSIQLLIHRAGTLEEAGRTTEARSVIDSLMQKYQNDGAQIPNSIRFELAKILVQESEYRDAASLINDLVTDSTTPKQMRRLQLYLLAKSYDRMREYDLAFDAASEANSIDQLEFHPKLYEEQVSTLIDQWSEDRISLFPVSNCDDELPVFIAGMPRSGTSLIDQIIDAHPHASGVGELSTIETFAQRLSAAYNPELDPPNCFGHMNRFRWSKAANEYIKIIRSQSPDESIRVVNKALGNNKLVGLLACLFPRTRVIHALRDPRDVAISCYMGGFNNSIHPWTTRISWVHAAWEQSQRMMAHWKRVLKVPILDVQYENLVSDPQTVAREIIDFLGLKWSDECMDFHRSKRTVRTLSYDQVNKPIYTSSVSRYLNYEHRLTKPESSSIQPMH
jgi:tetratricopeptide (TPR) repeat protein